MVSVYIRRKKKFALFYSRRTREFGEQTSLKKEAENNALFSSANGVVDSRKSDQNQEISEAEFESDAIATARQLEDNIFLTTGGNIPEDVPSKDEIPIGIDFMNDKPLFNAIKQLPSTACIQRKPRSTRKYTSVASSRESRIECSALYNSKQMASQWGASTLVSTEISPKTPTKEDKISKFTRKSLPFDVQGLLSTGILAGTLVKYKKENLELPGIVSTSGICCGCSLCNFEQVVSSLKFEKHAGSKSCNPTAHIFLENGKSLYAFSKELKNASLEPLGETVEGKRGYSVNKAACEARKAGSPMMHHHKGRGTKQKHFTDLLHELQASLNTN